MKTPRAPQTKQEEYLVKLVEEEDEVDLQEYFGDQYAPGLSKNEIGRRKVRK